jgi:hypothetical protein
MYAKRVATVHLAEGHFETNFSAVIRDDAGHGIYVRPEPNPEIVAKVTRTEELIVNDG